LENTINIQGMNQRVLFSFSWFWKRKKIFLYLGDGGM
jgi:hypothetical protein